MNQDEIKTASANEPPNPSPPPLPLQTPSNQGYEVLPDGRKRFLKATAIDIIFSIVMPPYGFFVGLFAFNSTKREKRRGATMMITGASTIAAIVTFAILSALADSYHVSHALYHGDNRPPATYAQLIDACALFVPILWLPLGIFLTFRFARKFR